jgi:ABC-2 type transport system ATP-binding protein
MRDLSLNNEAIGLTRSFEPTRVLDGVDLRVGRGRIFALLGPNGAGTTTAVRILATVSSADAGQPFAAGYDVVA